MIANRFINYQDDNNTIIFASGVSNSKDMDEEKFLREFNLLEQTVRNHPENTIVYFSTCSIQDSDLASYPYIIHKKRIEEFVKKNVGAYYIFRVSNVAGISNNPYTLLNYFIFNILKGNPLTVWKNAGRNIIGIDDMYAIVNYFLSEEKQLNTTINIANPENYPVPYIIACIERHLNKRAICNEIERGTDYRIDVSEIKPVTNKLNLQFDKNYLPSLLKKYYHSR